MEFEPLNNLHNMVPIQLYFVARLCEVFPNQITSTIGNCIPVPIFVLLKSTIDFCLDKTLYSYMHLWTIMKDCQTHVELISFNFNLMQYKGFNDFHVIFNVCLPHTQATMSRSRDSATIWTTEYGSTCPLLVWKIYLVVTLKITLF